MRVKLREKRTVAPASIGLNTHGSADVSRPLIDRDDVAMALPCARKSSLNIHAHNAHTF
jgi:hypothetical protein